jgi:hypothetical protein
MLFFFVSRRVLSLAVVLAGVMGIAPLTAGWAHSGMSSPVSSGGLAEMRLPAAVLDDSTAGSGIDAERLSRTEVPSQISVPGTLVQGLRWRDENGTNVYVAYTRRGENTKYEANDVELFAKQVVTGDSLRQVWDLYDFKRNCAGRGHLSLRPAATAVTDLDDDGETETTIAYTKTCDESADTYALKVLMLEGDQKYGLRGRTLERDELLMREVIDISGAYKLNQSAANFDQFEGQYNTEANFDEAPPSFLPFAKSKWRTHRRTWDEAHVAGDPGTHIDSTELRKMEVQTLSKDEVPSQIQYKGTFMQAKRWTDQNGDNVFIAYKREGNNTTQDSTSVELFAKQVVVGEETRRVWDIYDFVKPWGTVNDPICDPQLGLVAGGSWVTDLDADGQTETTIAYTKSCKTDVSPVDLKVLLMEGRRKYALRGETANRAPVRATWFWLDRTAYTLNQAEVDSVQQEERPYGGRYKNESSFEGAPDGFLEFARGVWKVSITP